MEAATYRLGNFRLQSGANLEDAFLAYETHGELAADKSNVILYPTWYSGNHEDIRAAIGPGRALDPDKYFMVVPDMFGNGHSSSPSNTGAPHDRMRFPVVTAYDNVIAQNRLLTEVFGIEEIQLVVGYSMSAQQAFHWGSLYPDRVAAIAPICGSAKTAPHNWLFLEGLKRALILDPEFRGGDYAEQPEEGLRAFTTVYASWAFSQTFYRKKLHLSWAGENVDSMEDFLDVWHTFFTPKNDANDLLAMLNTWQNADVSNHPRFKGDIQLALAAITCKAIVMAGRTDMYFPAEDNEIEVSLMPNAELRVIESIYGHAAGGPGFSTPEDDDFIDRALLELLNPST